MCFWLQFSSVHMSICCCLHAHKGKDDDSSLSKAVDSPDLAVDSPDLAVDSPDLAVDSPDLAGDDSTTHTQ